MVGSSILSVPVQLLSVAGFGALVEEGWGVREEFSYA
jgi:hypothetical protein